MIQLLNNRIQKEVDYLSIVKIEYTFDGNAPRITSIKELQ